MSPRLSSAALSYFARNRRLVLPSAPSIFTIRAPLLPQFRFEWHVGNRTVYLIRLGVVPLQGDPIAENVPDHGAAINTVAVWTRGFREGATKIIEGTKP